MQPLYEAASTACRAARREGLLAVEGLLPRLFKAFGSVIWYTTYMEARRWYARATALQPLEPHKGGEYDLSPLGFRCMN